MSENKLGIIWSSADPEVATHMLFMYAHNSVKKAWWQEVRLIIWGPSAKLLVENAALQSKVKEMAADGVQIWACKSCSDEYGVSEALEKLGINVVYVGEPFTLMLQSDWKVITF
jgi:hypothetical protein